MSKIGQSIIDTPLEDQTDPRDPGVSPEQEAEEQRKADEIEIGIGHALFTIQNDITFLENNHSGVNPDEIRAFADRLQDLAAKIEKPF